MLDVLQSQKGANKKKMLDTFGILPILSQTCKCNPNQFRILARRTQQIYRNR